MIAIEPLAPPEFELAARWLSDPAINRWLTAEWRERAVNSTMVAMAVRQRRNRIYCVRADGVPCGLVALGDYDAAEGSAMLWYLRGVSDLAGRGIMVEATRQLLQLAFTTLNVSSVHAWAMRGNVASIKVITRCGFREAGRLRNASTLDGQPVDRLYFDITRTEWEQNASATVLTPATAATLVS